MPIRGRRNRRFIVEDSSVEYRKHSALPFLGGSVRVSPLVNLSVGGMQFVSDDMFENGQRLDLKIMLPGAFRSLSIRGEVVWAKRVVDRDAYRTGVRFLQPDAVDVSLLRSLEEHYWSIADERKLQLEARVSERYPLHRDKAPDAIAEAQAAEAAYIRETGGAPAAEEPVPAPEPEPEPVAVVREAAPAEPAEPPAPEPPAQAPEAPAAPEAAERPPERPQPAAIPVYDLIAGVEAQPDIGLAIQGVPNYHVSLPGITDPDCFALTVHDNTMRHSGSPSFDRGDVVIFSPNVPARSGDLAFVATREGGVFRQIFFDANNVVRLRPLNGWYPEQSHHRGEVQGLWKLIGKYESYK